MDKEPVFGSKISVNFIQKTDADLSDSPPRNRLKYSTDESSTRSSSCSSRESSVSPSEERTPYPLERTSSFGFNSSSQKKFNFPPPPVIGEQNFPSFLKQEVPNQTFSSSQSTMKNSRSFPTPVSNPSFSRDYKAPNDWNSARTFCHPNGKSQEISAFSPFKKELDPGLKTKYAQRNVGRVSPFFMQDCDSKTVRNSSSAPTNEITVSRHNNFHGDTTTNTLSAYTNSGFHSLPHVPFSDIQRISDPVTYSSQWNGTCCLSVESTSFSRANAIVTEGISSVELQVSNLDSTFEVNEMKKILLTVFSEHVMVLHISMSLQPDGSAKATVKVPSLQDAQYAISRLHRKKIGHKRILISHIFSEKNPPFCVLKSETVTLLNDIPSKNLPLIKFRELYEKRFHRPIAISELYKMRDAVTIQGDSGSRMVYLNLDYCKTPSLPDSEDSQFQDFNGIEKPYCERHFHVSESQGWAEQYSICPLPLVYISLKTLSTAVHRLLDTHQGSLPLISFCDCYEAEIGPLPVVAIFDTPNNSESEVSKEQRGVPLEHLMACVNGVEVAKSPLCIKKVQWLEKRILEAQAPPNVNPALAGQLTLFGREVMDLLKSQPQCLVPFNKFIPTYHHHFGRQCRVADYGFTKLIDLLEAIPHIVQVLGEGQIRQVTLTHRTQIKRFSAELLRILKSRASKQIAISEFPLAYEQVIEKSFEITNYGVCEIEDLLEDVSENVIVICSSGDETVIGIPKREQTDEEIERTKLFAVEVIELMKHTPCCSMAFNKFIPAYHHHFGKQCRVADYGFTKLIELFEAIPDILQVTGMGEEKILNLVPKEQHKILTERLVSVLKSQTNEVIDIQHISSSYAQMHGHALRPTDFGFTDLHDLVEHMEALRIVIGYVRTYVTLVDEGVIHQISLNLRRLLMEQENGCMPIADLCEKYATRFGHKINPSLHFKDMTEYIQVEKDLVELTALQKLARQIIYLLQKEGGQVEYTIFRNVFQKYYHSNLDTTKYGFCNLNSLFEHLSDYFIISGKKMKRVISLNVKNLGILREPLPTSGAKSHQITIERKRKETSPNLIGFETPPLEGSNTKKPSEDSHNAPFKKSPNFLHHHQVTQESTNNLTSSSVILSSKPYISTNSQNVSSPMEHKKIAQATSVINICESVDGEQSTFRASSQLHLPLRELYAEGNTFEDLCSYSEDKNLGSSKSTPTQSSMHRNRRNRIAANFSMSIK